MTLSVWLIGKSELPYLWRARSSFSWTWLSLSAYLCNIASSFHVFLSIPVCHALYQGLFETGISWNPAQKCPVGNSHTREAVLLVIFAILFYTCASLSLFFYKASLDYSSTDIYVLSCLHILMWAAVPTCCKGLWRKVWYVCICVF